MKNTERSLSERIKTVLVEYGAILENWKINITNVETLGYSDFAMVTVNVTKNQCRKPFMAWVLKINTVKGTVLFDESESFEL